MENPIKAALKVAVINKRAGGMGMIMRRQVFQRPLNEGIEILQSV